MYALLDGNNFYCSVQRVFQPALRGRPLIVLSNNDACAVARSEEAKALGIKMGQPYFEVRHFEHSHGLVALSANLTLYGDVSDRMMSLAAGLGHSNFVYSIDECFCAVDGIPNITRRAWTIRERIERGIGIPCGIGIGGSLTLAKLANYISKAAERKPASYPEHLMRVCNLAEQSPEQLRSIFESTPVGEVWGIGRKIGQQLTDAGISNVQQLVELDLATVRRRWSVVLERTIRELQGQNCIAFEDAPPPKQMIACTRSFGRPVYELAPLIEAVSEYASRAAEKLRKQGSFAGQIQVFAHSSPFSPTPRFSKSIMVPLVRPSSDTNVIVQAAVLGVTRIFEPGYRLSKAGVILMDLSDESIQQDELLFEDSSRDRSALYSAMDKLNLRYGRGTVQMASAGLNKASWGMRQERRTPCYTTDIDSLPVAR